MCEQLVKLSTHIEDGFACEGVYVCNYSGN